MPVRGVAFHNWTGGEIEATLYRMPPPDGVLPGDLLIVSSWLSAGTVPPLHWIKAGVFFAPGMYSGGRMVSYRFADGTDNDLYGGEALFTAAYRGVLSVDACTGDGPIAGPVFIPEHVDIPTLVVPAGSSNVVISHMYVQPVRLPSSNLPAGFIADYNEQSPFESYLWAHKLVVPGESVTFGATVPGFVTSYGSGDWSPGCMGLSFAVTTSDAASGHTIWM